jgi:hypothetical protein
MGVWRGCDDTAAQPKTRLSSVHTPPPSHNFSICTHNNNLDFDNTSNALCWNLLSAQHRRIEQLNPRKCIGGDAETPRFKMSRPVRTNTAALDTPYYDSATIANGNAVEDGI